MSLIALLRAAEGHHGHSCQRREDRPQPVCDPGSGQYHAGAQDQPASLPELETITQEMPEQYQAMILLASWCALRFGELTELRRKDITLEEDDGVIRGERGVVRVGDGFQVTSPKSDAGNRDVAIPPHLVPLLKSHLETHVGPNANTLLFPAKHGGHLAPATLYRQFHKARDAGNRRDLRFHDLRHSGAVLAAGPVREGAQPDGARSVPPVWRPMGVHSGSARLNRNEPPATRRPPRCRSSAPCGWR